MDFLVQLETRLPPTMSPDERAALLARESERGRELRAVELDWIIWDISQSLYPVRPYHRTRTIFY